MVALIRSWRTARRRARRYQFVFLGAALACLLVWYVVQDHVCPGCHDGAFRGAGSHARHLFEVEDQFTLEQRRDGAVLLHCIGLLYMFLAIALVCDECFVPALEVITDVLQITPDVAGATFMAAGGSAPEFFTSLIGSLVTESDVGTGTIIGSAVFNVLFVIGACALVAPSALQLTWFPLARDSLFYAVDLVVVTCVFLDEQVKWFEAFVLFVLYLCYALFMRFSGQIEAFCHKRRLRGSPEAHEVQGQPQSPEGTKSWATSSGKADNIRDMELGARAGTGDTGEDLAQLPSAQRNPSCLSANSNVSLERKIFRHHSMRSSTHSNNIKQLESTGSGGIGCTGGSGDGEQHLAVAVPEPVPEEKDLQLTQLPSPASQQLELTNVVPAPSDMGPTPSGRTGSKQTPVQIREDENEDDKEDDEDDKPLSFLPPEDASTKDMLYYVLSVPIVFLLVITVPDVRRPGWRKYFPLTFMMSILWIAAFTWAMVWFCEVIGSTAGISDSILGMTVLAAGTSVPDMLTSMIVAREGHGDMAVSSSIGSNIFDVTVGLPVPWLIFNAVRGRPVSLVNTGLEISVMILLAMLGLTITTIMAHGWTMTKMMGASMMFLYVVFQGISIGLFVYSENGGSLKLIHV